MIRKPPADWQGSTKAPRSERSAPPRRRPGGAGVALRGGHALRGLVCYFFAAIWGFAALASGLAGSLPSLIGIGAMAAFMVWLGRRAFAKARATSG